MTYIKYFTVSHTGSYQIDLECYRICQVFNSALAVLVLYYLMSDKLEAI